MSRPSGFTVAWVVWVLFFLVVEGLAILRQREDETFSGHWWKVFHVRSKVPRPVRVVLVLVQLAFGGWLIGHLVFGWWSPEL